MYNPKSFIEQFNTSQTVIGLDIGEKTIGIAISDKSKTIASPIFTINRKGNRNDFKELLKLFDKYNVSGIVIGLPLSLNGEENNSTRRVREFADYLKKNTDLIMTFQDERFSSDVVFKELRKNSISITKIKKRINHLAASYILQGFLDAAKNI